MKGPLKGARQGHALCGKAKHRFRRHGVSRLHMFPFSVCSSRWICKYIYILYKYITQLAQKIISTKLVIPAEGLIPARKLIDNFVLLLFSMLDMSDLHTFIYTYIHLCQIYIHIYIYIYGCRTLTVKSVSQPGTKFILELRPGRPGPAWGPETSRAAGGGKPQAGQPARPARGDRQKKA